MFFLLGMPKSGTTVLYMALVAHPYFVVPIGKARAACLPACARQRPPLGTGPAAQLRAPPSWGDALLRAPSEGCMPAACVPLVIRDAEAGGISARPAHQQPGSELQLPSSCRRAGRNSHRPPAEPPAATIALWFEQTQETFYWWRSLVSVGRDTYRPLDDVGTLPIPQARHGATKFMTQSSKNIARL